MTTRERKIRVLLAKSDMDAHERGIRYVAQALREAGMEVIFIRYRIIDEVALVALQEDVDVIGLSSYSPGLMYEMSRVKEMLQEKKAEDILVLAGGTIPGTIASRLIKMGVGGAFPAGSPVEDIIECIRTKVSQKRI
jgi:methylmalonyl-CoA mutase C-terminal domain/subunit